jgi:stearoyl-CoA 9-desaturase NADPH oxidoreductase
MAKRLNPLFHPELIGARVVEVHKITPDVSSFVLQTNRGFGPKWPASESDTRHLAGQHIGVQIEANGRLQQRYFSLSSAPSSDGKITITVKQNRHAGTRFSLSLWMHRHLKVGAKLAVTRPQGEFLLAADAGTQALPMVMLCAGSGITPIMSMLRRLEQTQQSMPRLVLAIYRNSEDVLFEEELLALARRHPECSIRIHVKQVHGEFDWHQFAQSFSDVLKQSRIYACGPKQFARDAKAACGSADFVSENFGGMPELEATDGAPEQPLLITNRKQVFTISSTINLLQALEAAGLAPRFGCRAGICKQCVCLKRSGVVQNQQTGESSSAPNEWISICTHRAQSPIELVLE